MENRKIEGNYIANEDGQFSGMITGNLTVKSGVKFVNHGMVCRDVMVEENASFYNYGMVSGNVIGEGYAEIRGTIQGYLSSMLNTYVHKGAIIKGRKYEGDEKTF